MAYSQSDNFWGMTAYGGSNGAGVIFTVNTDGSNYNVEHNFTTATGSSPYASLFLASDGLFYGTTYYGGSGAKGTVFKYDTLTNTHIKLHDFTGANGHNPSCTFIEAPNGKLYGTTWVGGSSNLGTLFEMDITQNPPVFTKKIDFNGTNGSALQSGLLITSDDRIFGVTQTGGTNGYGVIFEYHYTNNTLTIHHHFAEATGRQPFGTMMEASDGNLYGIARAGGSIGYGSIFKFDPSDNSYENMHSFNGSDANQATGDLIEASDGFLYGLSFAGGGLGDGTIYQYNLSTGTAILVHSFNTINGKYPYGTMAESSNGKLYGMTSYGGSNNAGVLFEFNTSDASLVKKHDFSWTSNDGGGFPFYTRLVSGSPSNEGCISDTTNVAATTCDPEQEGITQQLLTNSEGCDSLVITTTTLIPGDITNVAAITCDPAQVGITQQLLTNIFGCDSLVITITTLIPGDTTNVAAITCDPAQVGVTQQLLSNIFGCDSLVIITTTLLPGDITNVAATTCDPAQVGVTQQLLSNIFGCDSLVITTTTLLPGDTMNIAATTCDPAQVGVTQQLLSNIFGCDSLVIITTTLLPSDITNLSATTCDPAQVGVTQQLLSNIFGCDSLIITTTTLLPSDITNLTATTCNPAQVGETQQLFSNVFGCDSLVITTTSLETEAPELVVISSPITLWPPNHNYESFELDDFVLSVSDNCVDLSVNDVSIVSVTSDEPENGPGDGNTFDDIVIGNDCKTIKLRRERKGNGNGRVYTIKFEIDDGNGNTGTASAQVYVPINKNETVIDDGVVYEVSSDCEYNKSSFFTENATDQNKIKNYPNPFRNKTNIDFSVSETAVVSLMVYNSMGNRVAVLFEGIAEPGQQYQLEFDGSSLSKGVYFCRLRTDTGVNLMKKMILMK